MTKLAKDNNTRAMRGESESHHTFTRDWLNQQTAMLDLSADISAHLIDSAHRNRWNDATTRALDHATHAVQIESARASLAVRIALVALIPSILLSGIIGATSILTH